MNFGECKYCFKEVNLYAAEFLKCINCLKNVHISCLNRPSTPGGLYGDVFFDYICQECSPEEIELFQRNKTPWFQTIILTLYHLQYKTPGTARKGYFHWKTHLVKFIEKHWHTLFKKNYKKKKNWIGTISGSLSHHSPHFVTSGSLELNDSGWWRLTFPQLTPGVIIFLYNELLLEKQITKGVENLDDLSILKDLMVKFEIPEWYRIEASSLSNPLQLIEPIEHYKQTVKNNDGNNKKYGESSNYEQSCTQYQENEDSIEDPVRKACKRKLSDDSIVLMSDDDEEVEPLSLLTCNRVSDFNAFWNEITVLPVKQEKVVELTLTEEKVLLKNIRKFTHQNTEIRRLQRKLKLRDYWRKVNSCPYAPDEVDREPRMVVDSFEYEIISPYTNRILKPYIRCDSETSSLWIRLLIELHNRVNSKKYVNEEFQILYRGTVDYSYLKPGHIPAINALCQRHFWPGIDISDALEYPDFTCVVLYKKIVIGFAFMVPDVSYNEAYISFLFTRPEWRNCGIAKFMIYHLCQTCMGKDITLHVAVDNPALFLYQKFGFKIEYKVLNFYDMYIREDSNQSKDAFFLRKER